MSTIYQCIKPDNRYKPPIKTVIFEASSEKEAINWLEQNGGGIYRNTLHNFECGIKAKEQQNNE